MKLRGAGFLCGAVTTAPVFDATVICELHYGHGGPHHGHIPEELTPEAMPQVYDWPREETL